MNRLKILITDEWEANSYQINEFFAVYNSTAVKKPYPYHANGWVIFHIPTSLLVQHNFETRKTAVAYAERVAGMGCIDWTQSTPDYWGSLKLGENLRYWVTEVGSGAMTAEECDRQVMQLKMEETA